MNITFKGIQNASASYSQGLFNPQAFTERIFFQLNNKNTNDLEKNQDILKKYPDIFNSDFIDYEAHTVYNQMKQDKDFFVFINSKKIDSSNPEDMHLLAKTNALLKRIADGEDVPLTNQYLKSDQIMRRVGAGGLGLREREDQIKILKDMSDPKMLQAITKSISIATDKLLNTFYNTKAKGYFQDAKNIKGFEYKDQFKDITRLMLEPDKDTIKALKKALPEAFNNSSHEVSIDMYKRSNKAPLIYINDYLLIPKEKNFEGIRVVTNLLKKMNSTEQEFQIPDNFLDRYFFESISKNDFPDNYLPRLHKEASENKNDEEVLDVKFNLIKANNDIRHISTILNNEINKQIISIFA